MCKAESNKPVMPCAGDARQNRNVAYHRCEAMSYQHDKSTHSGRSLSEPGIKRGAGTRLPHLEGHPGIELRKVLALLCVPRNQAPCRLQVVDSSLFMQGLAQPLERLYFRRSHS